MIHNIDRDTLTNMILESIITHNSVLEENWKSKARNKVMGIRNYFNSQVGKRGRGRNRTDNATQNQQFDDDGNNDAQNPDNDNIMNEPESNDGSGYVMMGYDNNDGSGGSEGDGVSPYISYDDNNDSSDSAEDNGSEGTEYNSNNNNQPNNPFSYSRPNNTAGMDISYGNEDNSEDGDSEDNFNLINGINQEIRTIYMSVTNLIRFLQNTINYTFNAERYIGRYEGKGDLMKNYGENNSSNGNYNNGSLNENSEEIAREIKQQLSQIEKDKQNKGSENYLVKSRENIASRLTQLRTEVINVMGIQPKLKRKRNKLSGFWHGVLDVINTDLNGRGWSWNNYKNAYNNAQGNMTADMSHANRNPMVYKVNVLIQLFNEAYKAIFTYNYNGYSNAIGYLQQMQTMLQELFQDFRNTNQTQS